MLIRLDKTEERWWGNRTILSRIFCSWDLGMQRHPTIQVKGVGIEDQIFLGGLAWYPL